MKPSEVRSRVLSDHEVIRGELDQLEALAREVSSAESRTDRIAALRDEAQHFLSRLSQHMRWEEKYLLPALREADAWGRERARRLIDDHREQREILAFVLQRVRDGERPDLAVARDVRGLVALLRVDMQEEESELLDPRVLRDDVIGIDVEAG